MKEKIAILTAFREFIPGYSLTGIVLDQVKILTRQGHEVDVFVTEDYHGRNTPEEASFLTDRIRKLIPAAKLTDYGSMNAVSEEHKAVAGRMSKMCVESLAEYDMVFTHDLLFTGWNLPYAMGIASASGFMMKQRWLHWVHSIPSGFRDWWNLRMYGTGHKVVYPNRTDLRRVCEQYRTEIENARVIPHPKDLRSWCDFYDLTCAFLDDYPTVMSSDIVQIYPASADRLHAKRLKEVILAFAEMKRIGWSVCLVVANQHATGRGRAEEIARYHQIGHRNGLTSDELIFTSDWRHPEFKSGIPKRMIRELFMCSNLFLYPTREETFGLVLPEALLSGGVLPIMNKSLAMMGEISGMNGDFIDFGSFNQQAPSAEKPDFIKEVANQIIGRLTRNESIMAKTYMRQRYNWDNLYRKFYGPIIAESVNW